MAWYNSTGKENHKSFLKIFHTIDVFSAAGIVAKLLEQISQFIFQNLNTIQEAFANLAITLTPNKLKQFKVLEPFDLGRPKNFRGLITINDKKLLSIQESGFKHKSQIIVKYS